MSKPMSIIGNRVGSAGTTGPSTPRPPRSAQSEFGSPHAYFELARYALRYDHPGMHFQFGMFPEHHLAEFKEKIMKGDAATRVISSVLLGYVAAKMEYARLFEDIVPAVRLLNETMPELTTKPMGPVYGTVESLGGIEDIVPFSQDNSRPIERVVEVVFRSLSTLLDRRAEGTLDDEDVSEVFTMMGVELLPFAVKSHAEVLGSLMGVSEEVEKGQLVIEEVVNGGIDVLRGAQEFGLTPETRGVAMNSLKSLMKRWEPLSPMGAAAQTFPATR
jgi:hypothetical protein